MVREKANDLKILEKGKPRYGMSTKKTDWGPKEKPANIPLLTSLSYFVQRPEDGSSLKTQVPLAEHACILQGI